MNSEETRHKRDWFGPPMFFDNDKDGPKFRALRNGLWNSSDSSFLALPYRSHDTDDTRSADIGFRCVLWLRLP